MKDFQSNNYAPPIRTLDENDPQNPITNFYIQPPPFSPGFLIPNSDFIIGDSSFYRTISQENFQIQEANYQGEFQDQSNFSQSSKPDIDDLLSDHPIQIESIKLTDHQIRFPLSPYEPNNEIKYWISRSLSAYSNASSNSSSSPSRPQIDDEIQAESIQIDDEIQAESTPLENYLPSSSDNLANNSSSYSPNIESKTLDSSLPLEANSLTGFRINNSLVPDFKMIEQTGSLLFLTFEYLTKNLKNCLRPSNHIRSLSSVQSTSEVSAEIVIGNR